MEPSRTDKVQNYAERRQQQLYGRHYSTLSSSSTSLPRTISSASLSNRSSVYAPNIEKQLHSLVIEDEDTQEERAEVLEQTFQEMDFDKSHYQHRLRTPSLDHGHGSHTSLSLLGENASDKHRVSHPVTFFYNATKCFVCLYIDASIYTLMSLKH